MGPTEKERRKRKKLFLPLISNRRYGTISPDEPEVKSTRHCMDETLGGLHVEASGLLEKPLFLVMFGLGVRVH